MSALGNRAKETTQSTGDTGAYDLDGPAAGFQSCVAAVKETTGVGTGPWTVSFCRQSGTEYEYGQGTLTEASPDTLLPTTIEGSSNGGSRVDWGAGVSNVFLAPTAKQLYALVGALSTLGLIKRTGDDAYSIVAVSAFIEGLLADIDADSARSTLAAQEDVVTTRGDLVKANATPKAVRLQIGNSNEYLGSNGLDPYWKQISDTDLPPNLPRSYGAGCAISNSGGDPTNDLDIAVGEWRDSTNGSNLIFSSPMTKRADASFVAGTNQGGMVAAGGFVADKWYHIFLIRKDSDGSIDVCFDDSVACTNIPTGYTAYRRIGSRRSKTGPAWMGASQWGDHVLWDQMDDTREIDQGDSGSYDIGAGTTVDLDYVPPDIRCLFFADLSSGTNTGGTLLSSIDQTTPSTPSHSAGATYHMAGGDANAGGASQIMIRATPTGTAGKAQCRVTVTQDNNDISMHVAGWIDRRGRDD